MFNEFEWMKSILIKYLTCFTPSLVCTSTYINQYQCVYTSQTNNKSKIKINSEDVDCLEFLTDIQCNNFPDGSGFELAFHFATNPYFTNSVLTKRYEVPNLLTEDEPILKNVTGTTIQWKPNQSLTFKKVSKKQRKKGGRGAGQIRTISKNERQESFFHFFSPPKMPALAEVMDEEEADAVEVCYLMCLVIAFSSVCSLTLIIQLP